MDAAAHLVEEKEVREHSVEAAQAHGLEAREEGWLPGACPSIPQRLRFSHTEFAQLWPDGDARIGREDVGREADVAELAADITHGSKGDEPVCLCLARVAKDQIEGDPNTGQGRLASGFVHLIDTLMALVHQLQYGLRGGFCAETHVGHATVGK